MGHIKQRTVSELMDVPTNLQMQKKRITIKEHDHPKVTGLATTTTRALTAK
jgi:hypothetical protein